MNFLLKKPLEKSKKIAFVSSFCMGDSLVGLIVANNLLLNGYDVTVYGDFIYALRDWFLQMNVYPLIKEGDKQTLAEYDTVISMFDNELSRAISAWHPHSIILSHSPLYLAKMSMVDIQVAACRDILRLKKVVKDNGIIPLAGLEPHKYAKRVVMHPTSSLARKNWPADKFIELTKRLRTMGYESSFVVSPEERPDWLFADAYQVALPQFTSLSAVAAYVFESGFFIGNDSGIGHLASNLGVPTVSIILRKGVARQWRPNWAPGKVVLSPAWCNPRPVKEKFWKWCTSVRRVQKHFVDLVEEVQ